MDDQPGETLIEAGSDSVSDEDADLKREALMLATLIYDIFKEKNSIDGKTNQV